MANSYLLLENSAELLLENSNIFLLEQSYTPPIELSTTDTTTFNLDLNTVVEEAFERCGAELRSGYDLRTARRSLNLLTIEWVNRGINLWTIDEGQITLVAGQSTYDLPADTVDLLEHVIRTGTSSNQIDINISRISVSTYAQIPNKNAKGRPIQVWINRKSGALNASNSIQYPQINVWPTPDNSNTYYFKYWRLRRIYDAGDGLNGQDLPFRFLPALTSGLAYYMSLKIPGALERAPMLKAMYEEQFDMASQEDREKAPIRFVPRQTFLR